MRLFVGIPVPMEIAASLSQVASRLPPACRRTAPEQMHVTLSFLGQASDPAIPCIVAELEQIAQQAFPLALLGLGTFPGVVFAKLSDEPRLNALAAQVVQRLEPCGFPAEQRPYHPHITLARSRDRRLKLSVQTFPPLHFQATEFVLYNSVPGPNGSRYQQLRHFALAAGA